MRYPVDNSICEVYFWYMSFEFDENKSAGNKSNPSTVSTSVKPKRYGTTPTCWKYPWKSPMSKGL